MKIKIFLWQVEHDRLQTASALKLRGGEGANSAACVGGARMLITFFLDVRLLDS
jgi:hypothetical protein